MILERKAQINISDLREQLSRFIPEFQNSELGASLAELSKLMHLYNGAMQEISTRLEILEEELQMANSYTPIHHLECRIKGLRSIYDKMLKRGLPINLDELRNNIFDVAGIRVICYFTDDIYSIEDFLLKQPDVTLMERKDYISNPKPNGYRSLHLVLNTPVYLSSGRVEVPVEIQLRTVAMDHWASIEHMFKYKNNEAGADIHNVLLNCAHEMADTERKIEGIRNRLL